MWGDQLLPVISLVKILYEISACKKKNKLYY